jgi:L-lactate dehydrogenase complex protein LldF
MLWRFAMKSNKVMNLVPLEKLPLPYLQPWLKTRTLPEWRGGEFRSWMKDRCKK